MLSLYPAIRYQWRHYTQQYVTNDVITPSNTLPMTSLYPAIRYQWRHYTQQYVTNDVIIPNNTLLMTSVYPAIRYQWRHNTQPHVTSNRYRWAPDYSKCYGIGELLSTPVWVCASDDLHPPSMLMEIPTLIYGVLRWILHKSGAMLEASISCGNFIPLILWFMGSLQQQPEPTHFIPHSSSQHHVLSDNWQVIIQSGSHRHSLVWD